MRVEPDEWQKAIAILDAGGPHETLEIHPPGLARRQERSDRRRAPEDLGDDRLASPARTRGPRPRRSATRWSKLAETRPEIVGLTADLAKYTDLHIFAQTPSGPLLPDGHGRAAADVAVGRPGARGLPALRDDLRGVRLAPRLRLHLPGDRRGKPQRQDRLRPARPDHRLRPEPPGDRGHRDLPRHAQPDHRRPVRRASTSSRPCRPSPPTRARSTCACCAATCRWCSTSTTTRSNSARPRSSATATTC